jgi:RNA polymerase sigma-70 factor (ECF subfamily)
MPWSSWRRQDPAIEPKSPGGRGTGRDSTSAADEDLIRTLYAEHAGPLLRYVVHLTRGDRAWAEDVVQETLLRAWRNPRAFDPARGPARAWLCTVARNIVVDGHRARQARPQEIGEDALAVVADPDHGDAQIEQALLSWEVADAVQSLSPDHRAVLLEIYYRGRSVAEAARTLGVPPGTVKSRTYYALKALRLALEERGVEP